MVNTGKRRADGPLGEGVRFVAVARMEDRVVVASYTHGSSSSRDQLYTDVLHKVIRSQKTVTDNPRLTITDREVGTVHYDTDRSAIFVAITAFEYPQRVAFKCLGDLRSRFQASFGEALHKSAEGGLSKPARQILADVCNTFEDPAAVDKTIGVLRQVEDLRWLHTYDGSTYYGCTYHGSTYDGRSRRSRASCTTRSTRCSLRATTSRCSRIRPRPSALRQPPSSGRRSRSSGACGGAT
jgi:hypothetical protein